MTHRFIPARAGNTRASAARCRWRSVHPRSRGEHSAVRPARLSCIGSSPLARGTRCSTKRWEGAARFIPARAGNTISRSSAASPAPVHPRSRGEHTSHQSAASTTTGSSPLARGTPVRDTYHVGLARFIPARAGNTQRRGRPRDPPSVHPRSRGEHARLIVSTVRTPGSSPLARGTPRRGQAGPLPPRFIPARAGNTRPGGARWSRVPVHPRSRGEHWKNAIRNVLRGGSSPLARGTPTLDTLRELPDRFIPARAGNTPSACCPPPCRPVHPRSRGEHSADGNRPH